MVHKKAMGPLQPGQRQGTRGRELVLQPGHHGLGTAAWAPLSCLTSFLAAAEGTQDTTAQEPGRDPLPGTILPQTQHRSEAPRVYLSLHPLTGEPRGCLLSLYRPS